MEMSQLLTTAFSARINKPGTALAVGALAMGLLLLASAIQAETVNLDVDGITATSIEGLEVGGLFYDVTFPATTPTDLYGPLPGTTFPFSADDTDVAVLAVIIALNNSAAEAVGTAAANSRLWYVGSGVNDLESGVWATSGSYIKLDQNDWVGPNEAELQHFDTTAVFADFTESGPGDPPPTAGSLSKQITCPAFGATVIPVGERIDIDDIIVSANQDQIVTLKFNPGDQIVTKLSMKAREPAVVNISWIAESLGEQSLRVDCGGNGKLFITVVGSKAGL